MSQNLPSLYVSVHHQKTPGPLVTCTLCFRMSAKCPTSVFVSFVNAHQKEVFPFVSKTVMQFIFSGYVTCVKLCVTWISKNPRLLAIAIEIYIWTIKIILRKRIIVGGALPVPKSAKYSSFQDCGGALLPPAGSVFCQYKSMLLYLFLQSIRNRNCPYSYSHRIFAFVRLYSGYFKGPK